MKMFANSVCKDGFTEDKTTRLCKSELRGGSGPNLGMNVCVFTTACARDFVLIILCRYFNRVYNWRPSAADLDNTDHHFNRCRCNKEKTGENRRESEGHTIWVSVHFTIGRYYKNTQEQCSFILHSSFAM